MYLSVYKRHRTEPCDEHREIAVKVTAWVDEAVAPLVEALNEYPWVVTLDSCEGYGEADSYVFFRVRTESPREAAIFAADLAAILTSDIQHSLEVEWRGENTLPLVCIACERQAIPAVSALLRAGANRRKTGSACGR